MFMAGKKNNLGRKGILGTAVCAGEGAASGTFWGKKVFFSRGLGCMLMNLQ